MPSVQQSKYDYLIVGAGLYGAICAHELKKRGYKLGFPRKDEYVDQWYQKQQSICGLTTNQFTPFYKIDTWD